MLNANTSLIEKYEYINMVTRSRKANKDRQYNGQKKM